MLGSDERRKYNVEEHLDLILAELQNFKSAFPVTAQGEVDVDGHRRYHEAKIKAALAEESFWRELKLDLAKKGAWFLLLVILGLVVMGAMAKMGIGGAK